MRLPFTSRFNHEHSLNIFSIAALGTLLVLFLIFFANASFHTEKEPVRRFVRPVMKVSDAGNALVIRIDNNGQIAIGPLNVGDEEVAQHLRDVHRATPNRVLFLQADRDAPYAKIDLVIRSAQQAGFPELNHVVAVPDSRDGADTQGNLP